MIALHKYMQMNTGEQELFKLKDNIGTRTSENELAINEIKLENKNEDSNFQSRQIWNSSTTA